jgi:hypothetical protein
MLDLWREGTDLQAMLNEPSEHAAVPSYAANATTASEAIRQAETVAREERRRLGLGNAPIGNLAALISAQGIWVAATALPDSLSGLFLNHQSIGLAILVNNGHRQVRRRFSYAHEYAHALFDRHETVAITRRDNATTFVEKRANAAAAFLMPVAGVADHLRQIDKGHPSRAGPCHIRRREQRDNRNGDTLTPWFAGDYVSEHCRDRATFRCQL